MLKTLLSLSLFLLSTANAATWVSNRDHSEVMFQVPYMSVSELTGRFNEFFGEIDLGEDGKSAKSLVVQISSSSIDTGNKMRDGHLKGSDFFQSQEHPYIIFKSQNITQVKKNQFQARGELTLKNITRPATIEFSMTDSLKDTWGYENRFVKFKSALNRKDYNFRWNKTLEGQQMLVGDVITYWGTFQIQPMRAKTPNSKHMIPDTQHIREKEAEKREEESSLSQKFRKLINGK